MNYLYNISYIAARSITFNLILMTLVSIAFILFFDRKAYRILMYLIFALIFDIGGLVIGKLYGYNLFIAPLFGLFDYFFWSRFFTPKKTEQRKRLIWLDTLLMVYVFLEVYSLSVGEGFLIIPGASLTNLFIIIVIIHSYLKVIKIESKISWAIYSFVFVYALFNSFFYLFLDFSVYWEDEYKFFVWLLRSLLLHLFYLFLPYYQWKTGKNSQHCLFG